MKHVQDWVTWVRKGERMDSIFNGLHSQVKLQYFYIANPKSSLSHIQLNLNKTDYFFINYEYNKICNSKCSFYNLSIPFMTCSNLLLDLRDRSKTELIDTNLMKTPIPKTYVIQTTNTNTLLLSCKNN